MDGSVLVQLVSVPVKNLPDLSFVYGLLHLYKNPQQASRSQSAKQDIGFPIQGIVVGSQERMVLFSTPYRSQRLYVRIGSKHHFKYDINNSSSPSVSGRQPQLSPKSYANSSSSDVQRKLLGGVALKAKNDQEVTNQAETVRTASIKHSNSLQHTFSTSKAVDASILELQPHLLPFQAQTLTQEFSTKLVRRLLLHDGDQDGSIGSPDVFATYGREKDRRGTSQRVVRSLLGGTAAAAGPLSVGEGLHKISDHEVLLTGLTDFGFVSVMLADQPLTSHKPTTPPSTTGGNANTTTATGGTASTPAQNRTTDGEFLVSIAIGETVLPGKFKALQSTAQPPSLRLPPAVQWGNTTSTLSNSRPPAGGATAAQECQYLGQLHVATKHSSSSSSSSSVGPVPDLSADAAGGTVTAVGDETSPAVAQGKNRNKTTVARHAKLEPVVALGGELSSGACGKTISFEANSFSLEVNTLKVKVELYALGASLFSLIQVFLVVYQITYCSTQAQAARISLVSLFGQSLLDANLCMAHLLLSFAFPAVFFASFIWICVLKMLLFSVLLMRFITNTYQARYAQELAAEGFSGVRRRLIGLHAGFYGVLLLVLLVSISFYERPVVAVFAMYSFWLPQAIYSAYTGTKHSFHPVYLIGVSLCHLFIPLYILGCPNNFLSLLSVYINPQYLAEMATEPDSHHSFHQQPLSSVSACWVLVIWMTVQVGLLMLQTALGPRFFIPKKWLPSKYDYKRPIPAHLCTAFPASNTSGGTSSSSGDSSSGNNTSRNESVGDIATTGIRSRSTASSPVASSNNIHGGTNGGSRGSWASSYSGGLQALFGYGRNNNSNSNHTGDDDEVEMSDLETGRLLGDEDNNSRSNSNSNSNSSSSSFASSASSHPAPGAGGDTNPGGMDCAICCNIIHFHSSDNLITPCDHVFHEECLQQWAHVKLECPVCRSVLPSLGDD
uniref:RING-type E3 ubiquitin transferase n=1 Tax=Spumella elongata TaxID=89044 RepID=A0A7S3MCP2_9STRA